MNSVFSAAGLSVRVFGLLGVLFLLAGCETSRSISSPEDATTNRPLTKVSATNAAADPSGSSDLLRAGDALLINYSGVTDQPPRVEDRIREDGYITLSLIGPVKAAEKTRAELQEEIKNRYVPRFYNRLTVTVNTDVRYFYVGGEVRRPGNYVYVGGMTLLKAIAAAGDFTDFARKSKIEITRSNGKVTKINSLKAQKDSKLDLPIYPDDRIFVPRRLI